MEFLSRRFLSSISILALSLSTAGPLEATDFIRGDANGDGAVTISDAHFLSGWMFWGRGEPECLASGDSNDDGSLDLSDSVMILRSLFMGGDPLLHPYPEVGPDPTNPGSTPCSSYGNGSPLEDPVAALSIRGGIARGGNDRLAVITLALSNSKPIAGYSVAIEDPSGFIEEGTFTRREGIKDLTGTLRPLAAFLGGLHRDGTLVMAYLAALNPEDDNPPGEIHPGQDVAIAELLVCLKPGTPAGEYPLTLQAGELAGSCVPDWTVNRPACPDTGRAIHPALVSGTLVVDADVQAGATCDRSIPQPPRLNIQFKLRDATGAPGSPVTVPFIVKADRPSTGFSYSVDFDEGVLQASGTRRLWDKPGGTPYEFEKFEHNNQNGYLVGAAVISLTDTGDVLPPREEVEVLEFDLRISPSAAAGSTELSFRDGGRGSGGPVSNKLIAGGVDITPGVAGSFVFVNGRVNIVPDLTTFLFIRGDANTDGAVDISDPTGTLGYLYLGGEAPRCPDAADSNDDGKLDIADPIMTLHVLFVTGGSLPSPSGAPGIDPTPDGLVCLYR